jgi:hypothetical protein
MNIYNMTDSQTTEQAIDAFNRLSKEDGAIFSELNQKIQTHNGEWGLHKGGERNADGSIEMPWIQNEPLISEFITFMQEKNLLPFFEWMKWSEGSELFTSTDPTKYDNIDLETALKLIYAATRKERFADGTIAWAFKSGGFPKLVNRLVVLRTQLDE